MKQKETKGLMKAGALNLLKIIIQTTTQSGELLPEEVLPFAEACQELLNCESPTQVALLSAFVEKYDDTCINTKELAHHFGVSRIDILSVENELDFFIKRGVIIRRKSRNDGVLYHLAPNVIPALRENKLPDRKTNENLTIDELLEEIDSILDIAYYDSSTIDSCCEMINELFRENQQLFVARQISTLRLNNKDLMTLCIMMRNAAFESNYNITQDDLKRYLPPIQAHSEFISFKEGNSHLIRQRIIEPICVSGQVDSGSWTLTTECRQDMLRELKLSVTTEKSFKWLISYNDIEEKPLFFSDNVTKEYSRLNELLREEKMKEIMANLERHKMRKCFTCLFYGEPGTGKTESVRQLARVSGRDIMLVDIPSVRSKWVGETEKNIKAVFERYRKLAKGQDNAPILLFNEADAILGRRRENCVDSVDKMENAMQDIILQEMETLEGVMIATTNISTNLDKAFDRRFLYKIKFEQPTPLARRRIWKSMLPDLTVEEATSLSEQYDLSGGEIENIARKYIIDSIINCQEADISLLHKLCKSEKMTKASVGFCI